MHRETESVKNRPIKGKQIYFIYLVLLFLLAGCKEKEVARPVTIKLTTWRGEVDRTDYINSHFTDRYPHITVQHITYNTNEYDKETFFALESGLGADIIQLHSFDRGYAFYKAGYLEELNDLLPELSAFPELPLSAWSTPEGISYALPSMGVTHGIFYNKDIFEEYNRQPPETWEQFLSLCRFFQSKNIVPIAQGTSYPWSLYEVVFSGLGPNFYGGEESRQKLLTGEMKLTDPLFVEAFSQIKKLKPFFPTGHRAFSHDEMRQIFTNRKAAMFIGGSWEVGIFEIIGTLDNIGWFPPPVVRKEDRRQFCYHVDTAFGLNKNSKEKEAALLYLKWLGSHEYARLLMEQFPGRISYTPGAPKGKNPLIIQMMETAENSDITIRTLWQNLSAREPTGNSLIMTALEKLYNDQFTPYQAAEYVQTNLETWYEPFKQQE